MQGKLLYNEPLAQYTSWQVGGPARCLYKPVDQEDLAEFLRKLPPNEPLLWLGYGSNTLVRDGGFPGTVILLKGTLNQIRLLSDTAMQAGAGVGCARLARFAADAGLIGTEFLAGIPGTVGGALALNAGANGGNIWELVTEVTTIDRNGMQHQRNPQDYTIAYRQVSGPENEWFVSATLNLKPGSSTEAKERISNYLARRAATQPIGQSSAGSTFRNPSNGYAGQLIEAAGLKGWRYGGAEVSSKHANFIINIANATAEDIENLIKFVQNEVRQHSGVQLIPEVKIVGVLGNKDEQVQEPHGT